MVGNDGAIASIEVLATVEGRFDDRLASTGSGFLSATDLLLTTWGSKANVPTVIDEVRADDPRPGPLVADGGRVAWGATVTGGLSSTNDERVRAAVAESGDMAPRHFRLRFGAASLDGKHVLLCVERVEPRARPGQVPEVSGPRARWVIMDAALTSVTHSEDELISTAHWDGSEVVACRPGSFVIWSAGTARALTVEDGTVARSLVPLGDGRWVAGMASGRVVTFAEGAEATTSDAHSGPITALAYDRTSGWLASGGEDGWIFVTRPSGGKRYLGTGQAVDALTWADGGTLVAKIGGPGGRLLVMRPD